MKADEAARAAIAQLCDKVTDDFGFKAIATKVRMGDAALAFLKAGAARSLEGWQVAVLGVPIYCDLEDPLGWSVEMSDGTVREGRLRLEVDFTDVSLVECNARPEPLDYLIKPMICHASRTFKLVSISEEDK